jgi:N12 class adenine-specific DNA methylase
MTGVVDTNAPGVGAIGRARASMAALETLAAIRAGAREYATAAEQDILRGWSGWGPMAKLFSPDSETWAGMAERAAELLPEADLMEGHQGTYNAFFTPDSVARAMWDLLIKLGFEHGEVAELGCGAGAFMQAAPPPSMVKITGIERDPTSAAIAKLLHPEHAVVQARLQDHPLPSKFAAVIGNVPFGDVKLFDPTVPDDHRAVCQSLHHYFMYRAVKALRPGGIALLLTSRHTMDAFDHQGVRKYLTGADGDADFVGAMRLPAGGLGGGTDIVSDIIVLRRRVSGDEGTRPRLSWVDTSTERFGHQNPVNGYWSERPGLVLGTMVKGKTSRYGLNVDVEPIAGETAAEGIARAGEGLVSDARDAGLTWTQPPAVEDLGDVSEVTTPEGWLENSFHFGADGKTLLVVKHGRANPVPRPNGKLIALVRLKDLVEELVAAEADHGKPDDEITPLRQRTAAAYKAYVKRYGALNAHLATAGGEGAERKKSARMQYGFQYDPAAPLVSALGVFDEETGVETPAGILFERQNRRIERPERTDDPAQALAWSLDRTGGVDLTYIARLLGWSVRNDEACIRETHDTVAGLLGDAVFREPDTGAWECAEAYLSGNVREKLRTAETAAEADPAYRRNVEALRKALPEWLGPDKIIASLGAPWIGPADVKAFLRDLVGHPAEVKRLKESNRWQVTDGFTYTTAARETWGTPNFNAYELVESALNGKTPVVKYRVEGGGSVKDEAATLAACEMQTRIKQRFAEWVWEDAARADRLCKLYNEKHNALVPRTYNGDHITIEGMAPEWVKKVYPHQREYIARGIATPATLCALPVGSGKSFMMTALAVKLKQLGLVRKPMLVVPNHLLDQADAEARRIFPAARILSSGSTEISANRRAFAARVATQDWDIVIVTQSAFDLMPVHPETEQRYEEVRLAAMHRSLLEADPDGKGKGREVKAMAKKIDRLTERIHELQHRARGYDVGVTFEQLGVDWVGIDEAHAYKNLAVACNNDGFNIQESKRALRLDMKLRWLAGRSPRHAALFTGTPVSNTMLELYVMMQYLMPEYLDSIDLGSADAWCAAFVEMVTKVGVTVDGGSFEMKTKPARFINAPELRVLFSMVADMRTADQLGLKRPAKDERIVKIQPTDKQVEYVTHLVSRAKACKGVRRPEKGADNMLKVCTHGRWAATDPFLVGLHDDQPSKLHAVADLMIEVWREHPDELQMGALDIGTPNDKDGDQSYGRLADLLVERGMPRNLIAFAHDAKTHAAKAAQFKRANNGPMAVILGSTGKLGTGTNIQKRLIAVHHIDAPFTPSAIEQRDGRALRPGNRNKTVMIFRYVTTRTFDAYLWELLVRKLGFIEQITSGSLDRTIEDCSSDQLMTFSAVQASATDQPLLKERADVAANVNRLLSLRATHEQKMRRNRQAIPMLEAEIAERDAKRKAWQAIADATVPDEIGKELAEQLHEQMGRHRYYSSGQIEVGSLTVTFGTWRSAGDQPQPVLQVDGGAGYVTSNLYENYKPETVAERVLKVAGQAAEKIAELTHVIDRVQQDIAEKQALLGTVFGQQDELVTAETRLAQIDTELEAEATRSEAGDAVVVEGDGQKHELLTEPDPLHEHLVSGECSCGEWRHRDGDDSNYESKYLVEGAHRKHLGDVALKAKLEAGAQIDVDGTMLPERPAAAAPVARPARVEGEPWVTVIRVTPPPTAEPGIEPEPVATVEPEPMPEPEPARVVTLDDLDTGDDAEPDTDEALAKAFTDPESMSRAEQDAAAAAIFAAFIPAAAPEPEPDAAPEPEPDAAAAAIVQAFMEAADREAAALFATICG